MGGDQNNPQDTHTPDKAIDGLVKVVMSLPNAVRALVVIVVLIAVVMIGYQKFFSSDTKKDPNKEGPPVSVVINNQTAPPGAPPAILASPQTQQYTNGRLDPNHPGAANDNPQNKEANHKSAEDNAASAWHFDHLADDNPPEVSIGADTDRDNYLHYRYFEKSDKCVFLDRRVAGVDHTQWVRNPLSHMHDVDLSHSTRVDPPMDLLPVAFTPAPPAEPVQAGYCVNPHPGSFRYWWGQPIDQCNSPMFRQFGDGCLHYQIYNRCANSWDGRIFWTACRPPPHR